jgi:ATP-binding cassette subfamily B multidrug efflux pump
MKLITKYLKPFIVTILLIVVLLFIQARSDLDLPNYMSNIINVGIQQNGIEHASPIAISESGMNLMQLFMDTSDKKIVNSSYMLVTKGDTNYIKEYPYVSGANIYIQNVYDKSLDLAFGRSTVVMFNFLKSIGTGSAAATTGTVDFTKLYQMLPVLSQSTDRIEALRATALQIPESLQLQMATSLTKNFYEEIKVDVSKMQNDYIVGQGIIMILITIIGGTASIMVGYLGSKMAAKVAMRMRNDVFKKVMSYTNNEINKFGSSSLITRTTNDISQVQQLVFMGVRMMAYAPIIGIGGIMMALEKSSSMSWIIALAVGSLITIITVVFFVAIPKFKKFQILIDKLNLVARENLNGLMVIRAFGSEKFEAKRFEKASKDIADTNLFIGRVMSALFPIVNFIMSSVVILIVWVASHQIADSTMQIGDMMAFMQYTMQIIMAFLFVTMMFILVPRASVSLKRIDEVLNTDPIIKNPISPIELDISKKGLLEFKNVSFKYSDAEEDVLHNISFTAKPNEITAFIGSTGSGKSTLINLIPRFYDVTKGHILLSGVDIRDINTQVLREKVGYIPQKGVLLSGTILSNIKFGKDDALEEEISTALAVAQADFVNELEAKTESPISQGGANVSGGQKQRLSIARALIKKPDIYIFDDSFSALDFKTDAKLRHALKDYTKGSTVLIVAQRISTIMHADQIVVLDQGKIVGIGNHNDLLKTCPTYFEIASSQLSEEELA